jgi:mRNA interferase RelE/StbE
MKTEFKTSFLNSVRKIKDDKIKADILRTILKAETVENILQIHDLKKLKGYRDFYRIRIGNYRIGIKVEKGTIVFAALAHRKDIYRIFPK